MSIETTYTSQDIKTSQSKMFSKKNGILLDLSDLHYTKNVDEENEVYLIVSDLKKVYFDNLDDKLNLEDIDYMIISGDFVEYGSDEKAFKKSFNFISALANECNIPFEKIVIVPGNHDLSWDITMAAYNLALGIPSEKDKVVDNIGNDLFYLKINNELWNTKFANYSKYLYEKLYGIPFSKNPKEQLKVITGDFLENMGIAFFMLNTSTDIDHFHREITYFDTEELIKATSALKENNYIKIAVGHHPINLASGYGNDIVFANALQNENFKIYLHGHVHRDISLVFINPQNINPKMIMVGAGSMSAGRNGMWTGIPQRYNIIKINKTDTEDKIVVAVNTRQRESLGNHWQPAYIYYNDVLQRMTNIWESII